MPDLLTPHRELMSFNAALTELRQATPLADWPRLCQQIGSAPAAALLRQDPFTERAWRKPRGYPGDAEIIDLIYEHREILSKIHATGPPPWTAMATDASRPPNTSSIWRGWLPILLAAKPRIG